MSEELKLLLSILDIKLKSNKVYDMFICDFVRVYKLEFGNDFTYITKEDYEKLKSLGIKSFEYDD